MSKLARFSWIVLGWNVVTILGGAVVRATGSGAGCGRSWPTCQGTLIPELRGATAIEFGHRLVSGVALLAVLMLVLRVFRDLPAGALARRGAVLSGVAIVGEALIGALIVFSEWVADDASVARVIAVPLHLVNTLFLLAALTFTTFWLSRGEVRLLRPRRSFVLGLSGMVIVAATGAVTALADTLFPKAGILLGSSFSLETGEHFLTRLRVFHPFVAVAVGLALALSAWRSPVRSRVRHVVVVAVLLQFVVGAANVVAHTPIALSLMHLLLADVLWIAWIWLALDTSDRPATRLDLRPSVSEVTLPSG